jgi:hypothetical protein
LTDRFPYSRALTCGRNDTGGVAIARGAGVRDRGRLRKAYGIGRWRKMKGVATIRLEDGATLLAELHWYEAHGIGRREFKIKRFLP